MCVSSLLEIDIDELPNVRLLAHGSGINDDIAG
jgi:hypothetical protein